MIIIMIISMLIAIVVAINAIRYYEHLKWFKSLYVNSKIDVILEISSKESDDAPVFKKRVEAWIIGYVDSRTVAIEFNHVQVEYLNKFYNVTFPTHMSWKDCKRPLI